MDHTANILTLTNTKNSKTNKYKQYNQARAWWAWPGPQISRAQAQALLIFRAWAWPGLAYSGLGLAGLGLHITTGNQSNKQNYDAADEYHI